MKINKHEKAPSAPTLEADEAVNISKDIHMKQNTASLMEKFYIHNI